MARRNWSEDGTGPHLARYAAWLLALSVFAVVVSLMLYDLWPWLSQDRAFDQVQQLARPGDSWSEARARLVRAGFVIGWEEPPVPDGIGHGNPEISIETRHSHLVNGWSWFTEKVLAPDWLTIDSPGGLCMIDIDSSYTVTRLRKGVYWIL